MPDYRLYCLDAAGSIETADWVQADNDEEAIAQARAKVPSGACELWQRNRLVAKIPPSSQT